MAGIIREKTGEHSFYAVWKITESLRELEAMIPLRPSEAGLYESFQVETRKKQWLAYRVLIKSMLLPEEFLVEYDETGKPFLAGSKYHISVTHSGDLAAVIISSKGRVGIDLETARERIERVKERFLHPEELAMIGEKDVCFRLTQAWCAKEALYKLFGHRGLDFRENIRIHLPPGLQEGDFDGHILHDGAWIHFPLTARIISGSVLVYAAEQ